MKNKYSVQELEIILGENLKRLRLQKNLDRQTISKMSGVSVGAVLNLETGRGATIKTLIKVIKTLGKEEWLLSAAPQVSINPLHLVRSEKPRQRARSKKNT